MPTWPQCAMVYDGSFTGFLSCVAESFRRKEYPVYFLPPRSSQLSLYPLREIPSDPAAAKAVYQALETKVSRAFQRLITYGFLTCLPQKERHMFDLIYLGFLGTLPQDLTDDRVLVLTRAIRHLIHEAHQFKGFVRFSDYGGVLVGQISPKNRVLPLLRPHFCQRLPEEAFLLHDKTHREGLFYAHHKWKIRPVDHLALDQPDQAEASCRALWKQFYHTVAIPARYNPNLRRTHMPKRYWGDMTEFQPDPAPEAPASLPQTKERA